MAIQAIRSLLPQITSLVYDGYEKGRFMKSDDALRAELGRRCEMLARHAEKLQSDANNKGHRTARKALSEVIDTLHILQREIQFSVSGTNVSSHSGIGKLKSKSIKKLVKHDSASLQSMVDCTRLVNAIAEKYTTTEEEKVILGMVSEWSQAITRSRNRFLERNMFIDGLVKR
ncbi:MAG: hypothetical protein CMB55_04000 [Euryarchaeota archaeon]|nr:hypothetical protein [Euryarchaeota archaeon]|tara:strand:- start:2255 stop:2773 length:519 start_codon:yes stop_codon:yes gene_type:complete